MGPKKLLQEQDDDSSGISRYLSEVVAKLDEITVAEDFQVLVENVLDELDGQEVAVFCKNIKSRNFEKFIPHLKQQHLSRIFEKVDNKVVLWKLASNVYASRVYQSFLRHLQNDNTLDEKLFNQLQQHGSWISEDLQDYVFDGNASHVFRDYLGFANGEILTKHDESKKRPKPIQGMEQRLLNNRQPQKQNKTSPRIPKAVRNLLQTFLQMDKNVIWDLIGDRKASLCVQAILDAAQGQKEKLDRVVQCIIPEKAEDIHQAINHYVACHSLEAALKVSSKETLARVFETAFQGQLMQLANKKYSTFFVQTFISSLQSIGLFRKVMAEFNASQLAQLFDDDKGGVLLCLAEKARQLNYEQILPLVVDMVNFWVKGQGQGSFKAVAPLLMTRNTGVALDQVAEGNEDKTLSYVGCTLLVSLFKFTQGDVESEIHPFIQSLSELAKEKVVRVARDKFGSRVIEAFFKGKKVDNSQKRKVFKKFKGAFVELALTAPGSFVVEAIFEWGEIKLKKEIASELLKRVNDLDQDRRGLVVSNNLDLKGFYEDKKSWEGRIKFQESMKLEINQEFGQKQTLEQCDEEQEVEGELSKLAGKIEEQEVREIKISGKEKQNMEEVQKKNGKPQKHKKKKRTISTREDEEEGKDQMNCKPVKMKNKQKSLESEEIYNQLQTGSCQQKVKKKKIGDNKQAFEEGLNLVQSVLY